MKDIPADRIAWLFAGIGDARHFFGTISYICTEELQGMPKKNYHFTLLDLKPSSLARNLLLFQLLSDLGPFRLGGDGDETMACIIYVYGLQIMPSYAYDMLQKTLDKLIDKVSKGEAIARWIYVPDSQRSALNHHLRAWQRHLDGKYDAPSFRKWGIQQDHMERMSRLSTQGRTHDQIPPFCDSDQVMYETFGIMIPNASLLRKHEPTLDRLIKNLKPNSLQAEQRVRDYLDENWKPNVTIIDVDWDIRRETDESSDPYIFSNPSKLGWKLNSGPDEYDARLAGLTSTSAYFEGFFNMVSGALKQLEERLTVEVVIGEMSDCFERIHLDAFTLRDEMQGNADPQSFPKKYDRIHMSNIP